MMGLEFVGWLEPAPAAGRPRLLTKSDISELKARVGEWAKVREYGSKAVAGSSAAKLRASYKKYGITFTHRGAVLYARALGPGEQP